MKLDRKKAIEENLVLKSYPLYKEVKKIFPKGTVISINGFSGILTSDIEVLGSYFCSNLISKKIQLQLNGCSHTALVDAYNSFIEELDDTSIINTEAIKQPYQYLK